MPVPSTRNKILPVRGDLATLQANLGSLVEGEICYALDEDKLCVVENGTLVVINGIFLDGSQNTGAGSSVLQSITTGNKNTAVGYLALNQVTSGFWNTACGAETLTANNNWENVAVGYRALYTSANSYYNVAVGTRVMLNTVGNNNVGVGSLALTGLKTGYNNTAVGDKALFFFEYGNYNTAFGSDASYRAGSGYRNASFGYRALFYGGDHIGASSIVAGKDYIITSSGDTNFTLIGAINNNPGTFFTATGVGSGSGVVAINTSNNNSAFGTEALYGTTYGQKNSAIGEKALRSNTTGDYNTAAGADAFGANTTGSNNTATGYQAGYYLVSGASNTSSSNCSCLGFDSRISGDNQVQLGNSLTTTYAFGAVQNRSDARDKIDVRDTVLGLNFINSLRPVDYRWDYRDDYFDTEEYEEEEETIVNKIIPNPNFDPTDEESNEPEFINQETTETVTVVKTRLVAVPKDGSRKRSRFHHGLIAQEVKAAADAINVDFGGYQDHNINNGDDVLTIGYNELIAPMIKALQEATVRIETLEAKVAAFESA